MNLQFQNPTFLYALALVAIPIIIHLFNFRKYKTIYFSNIQFISQIEQQSRSRSRLKQLLLLATRILTIVFLVLAFAQIYIPTSNVDAKTDSESSKIVLYIDNSFSMNAEGKDGVLLESAKQKAVSIVKAFPPETEFYLITNDFKKSQNHEYNRERCLEQITNVDFSPNSRNLSQVCRHVRQMVDAKCKMFVISDLQATTSDIAECEIDSLLSLNLVPMKIEKVANLFIDSCWFPTPYRTINANEQLMVRVQNRSDEAQLNIPLQLFINDSLKAMTTINIEPNASETVELSFTNSQIGNVLGRIELQDYPITFDNTIYFSYKIAPSVNILEVTENSKNIYLHSVFANDSYFKYEQELYGSVDFSFLSTQQLIILNGVKELSSGWEFELNNFVKNGGSLLFVPNLEADFNTYNNLYQKFGIGSFTSVDTQNVATIGNIDYNHYLLRNVFSKIDKNILLPQVKKFVSFNANQKANNSTIISLNNELPYLMQSSVGKGNVYTILSPMEISVTDFVRHPLFVSSVYNMALFTNVSSDLYYTIGKDAKFEMPLSISENNSISIVAQNSDFQFIPNLRHNPINNLTEIFIENNINIAQNYLLKSNENILQGISMNFNRAESVINPIEIGELDDTILSKISVIDKSANLIAESIKNNETGLQLWKLMIICSLLFLLVEILIIKYFK